MKRRIFNKLAGNKIHENLASNGKGEIAITRILSEEEYMLALRERRGGFDKKLFLEEIRTNDN